MLKWLKANECPLNIRTFTFAAEHGSLVNMIWLKANGCPCNELMFACASMYGSLDNMIWLNANGCMKHISGIHSS